MLLSERINKVLKIGTYILLAAMSYFVTLDVLSDTSSSMNVFGFLMKVIIFMIMIFLAKYTSDLFFLSILKLKQIPIAFYYIFPLIRIDGRNHLFIDPMFLTRSYEYFDFIITKENVRSIRKSYCIFLQVIFIATVIFISLLGWNFYLYLPIFIMYFGTSIHHPTAVEVQSCNSSRTGMECWNDKWISNLQFHILALMCIKNKELDNVILKFNFYNRVYKVRDLHLILYWSSGEYRTKEVSKTFLSYGLGENLFTKILSEKIVPLHLKYYKRLIDYDAENRLKTI